MSSDTYKLIRIDSKKAVAKAKKRPVFTEAWDALQEEYAALSALLKARQKAGLTQEELAHKMGTSQSTIARLESGSSMPSMRTLSRFAKATNCEMQIQFKQLPKSSRSKVAACPPRGVSNSHKADPTHPAPPKSV